MNNKAKSAVMLAVFAGLTGCNKDSGIVGKTKAPAPEVKVQKNPIKRIVYANNALDDNWFDSSNRTQMVDSRANLSEMMAKNVYLILDASSTTTQSSCFSYGSKQQVMEAAVYDFIDEIPGNTNLGVIRFDANGPNEITSLEPVNVTFLKQLLSETNAGGKNPVAITVSYAYKGLQKQAIKQQGYGEYHIVLLTDGGSDNANELLAATRTITESSPVVIHAYDFCPRSDNVLSSKADIDYKSLLNDESLRNAIHGTFPRISMSYEPPFKEGENDPGVGNVETDEQVSSTDAIESEDNMEADQSAVVDRDLVQEEAMSKSEQESMKDSNVVENIPNSQNSAELDNEATQNSVVTEPNAAPIEQKLHDDPVDEAVSDGLKPVEVNSENVSAAIGEEDADHQSDTTAQDESEVNIPAKETPISFKENESNLIEETGVDQEVDKNEYKTEPVAVVESEIEEPAETDMEASLSNSDHQAGKVEFNSELKDVINNVPDAESIPSEVEVPVVDTEQASAKDELIPEKPEK